MIANCNFILFCMVASAVIVFYSLTDDGDGMHVKMTSKHVELSSNLGNSPGRQFHNVEASVAIDDFNY